jgi:Transcriptional regulator containing an amidase domain and an AraC-type DNA-binding HTH domain
MCRFIYSVILLLAVVGLRAEDNRVFRAITASYGLADNSAQTLKCTKTGRMTITTIGNINFYDGASFSHINADQEEKYLLPNYRGQYHLYYDSFHHLWLKGSGNVTCVNLNTETFISNMDSLFTSLGMKGQVYDMFVDQQGEIWLCGKDFIQAAHGQKPFPVSTKLNLQDMDVWEGKDLLLFYEDGSLLCYDVASGKQRYRNRAYGEDMVGTYNRSSVLKRHNKGLFQIRNGEKGGILLHYDVEHRTWKTIMTSEYHLNNMAINGNMLYVASEWGYFIYDIPTGNIEHKKTLTLTGGRPLDTDVNAVEFDRQGGMWVGTEKRGLLYARPQNAPFTSMRWDNPETAKYYALLEDLQGITEFNGKKANVMFIDSRRWTWVGTSVGLYLYKSPQAEPILVSRKSGLLNDVIHAIIEDNMHNVWVAASYGISCLQIANGDIKYVTSFNEDDNVPNETFIDGKVSKLEDGRIVMQSLDHIILFNPEDFRSLLSHQPMQMYPKLVGMLVNGTNVTAGTEVNGSVILQKAITRVGEIDLNYDQNTVSLTFSALNFARPLQTYYRVRIKELDKEWHTYSYYNSGGLVDRRGLFHIPLMGLRPGSYHIELQASDVIDNFVGEPFQWVINVHEPWWRATGVLALMTCVLLALIIANFLLYNRNTRLRAKRNSDEGDMVLRIQNFVERCEIFDKERIGIDKGEQEGYLPGSELSPEFIDLMLIVMPYVKERGSAYFSIRELIDLTGTDVTTFYKTISSGLYKNPRGMIRAMRLIYVQQLLRTTNKSVEEISEECNFVSPNCMISSFYHQFRMTPREYRLSI